MCKYYGTDFIWKYWKDTEADAKYPEGIKGFAKKYPEFKDWPCMIQAAEMHLVDLAAAIRTFPGSHSLYKIVHNNRKAKIHWISETSQMDLPAEQNISMLAGQVLTQEDGYTPNRYGIDLLRRSLYPLRLWLGTVDGSRVLSFRWDGRTYDTYYGS